MDSEAVRCIRTEGNRIVVCMVKHGHRLTRFLHQWCMMIRTVMLFQLFWV